MEWAGGNVRNVIAALALWRGRMRHRASVFGGGMRSVDPRCWQRRLQVDGADRDEAMRRALEIVAAAPQEEARRMAHMVMSSVDQHDHDRFAEQFVELNLALGNRDAAVAAIVNAALAEQARGSYKAWPKHVFACR